MLKNASKEFKAWFLLRFTEELIKNQRADYFLLVENAKKEKIRKQIMERNIAEQKQEKPASKKIILTPIIETPQNQLKKQVIPNYKPSNQDNIYQTNNAFSLQKVQPIPKIQSPPLPQHLRNVTPIPSNEPIDLGTLNPLLSDPTVLVIECRGPDNNIIVRRHNGEVRNTSIMLTREQIDYILETFSLYSKIPLEEGITRIAFGDLVISAIISEVVEPRFTISKIR